LAATFALDILKGALAPDPARLVSDADAAIGVDAAAIPAWLEDTRRRTVSAAQDGDAVAAAMLAGLAEALPSPVPPFEPTLGGLAGAAAALDRAGDRGSATLLLLALAEKAPADGLTALAAFAAEEGRLADAAVLAGAALEADPSHPRAHLIFGFVDRETGSARSAQQHLAATSRLARRLPAFREDQRIAQQLLLLLHLS
jgi:hypothetical protein